MADGPAFHRLGVDLRRTQLLELGERLFTTHAYTELSMSAIAREAGISKALLYHYFPSKQAYFEATLHNAVEDLRVRTAPDPSLAPAVQLQRSLDAYLAWIEEHADAYTHLLRTAREVAEVRALVEGVRQSTAARILQALPGDPPPAARTAVRGWLWFMDGACLDWIEERDVDREALRELLLGTLAGALLAAGARLPDVDPDT
jgi:AcrR family transcriptional regulator